MRIAAIGENLLGFGGVDAKDGIIGDGCHVSEHSRDIGFRNVFQDVGIYNEVDMLYGQRGDIGNCGIVAIKRYTLTIVEMIDKGALPTTVIEDGSWRQFANMW